MLKVAVLLKKEFIMKKIMKKGVIFFKHNKKKRPVTDKDSFSKVFYVTNTPTKEELERYIVEHKK